ncbi:MAG: L,D-transpeptidase, partial [Bdellovibrionales bacterium]
VQYPDWSPPEDVRRDHPSIPNVIRGGDPANPMGVAAILLDRSEIAIHGTTASMRKSIGTAASYGCIRMLNEDVADLYQRVNAGTPVLMIP